MAGGAGRDKSIAARAATGLHPEGRFRACACASVMADRNPDGASIGAPISASAVALGCGPRPNDHPESAI
jgi:hypothetical protein